MTKPSAKAKSYIKAVRAMGWPGLQRLWVDIRDGKTDGWDQGKALEHLIVRAFELGRLDVEYPYDVPRLVVYLWQVYSPKPHSC